MFRIALIYDARLAYDLKVMTGVATYLQEGDTYSVYIEESALKDQRLPDLRSWEGDGIIADFDDPAVAKAVVNSRIPAVGFGSGYGWYAPESRIPYFFTDNQAISQIAAEHLLDLGFRHFAYCGSVRTATNGWSQERERAFTKKVKEHGHSCAVYHGQYKTSRRWGAVQRTLGAWLWSLPKPLGVMADNDNRARHVLEACRASRLRVPEDVAVIGVDNDELLCQLSSPLLSSVEQGARRIGYEAAALLNIMMKHGKTPRQSSFIISPVGVVARQSTSFFAVEDPNVARATRFIQNHAFDSIKVPDVVKAAGVSRSGLEARFSNTLGYTIHRAIRKVKLERVRMLVSDTNLPLKQVAARTGFKSIQHMTTLFGAAFGLSPAKYREKVVGAQVKT